MRKIPLLFILLIAILLSACSTTLKEPEISDITAKIDETLENSSEFVEVDDEFISGLLGVEADQYLDFKVKVIMSGMTIDEYGIFKANSQSDADKIKKSIDNYIQMRIDTWMGYTPLEFPKLEKAYTEQKGNYVIYAIIDEKIGTEIKKIFNDSFK